MVGRTQAQKQKAREARQRKAAEKERKVKLVEEGIVEVKIKGKKYQMPFKQGKVEVVMMTNHPTDKNRAMVWVKQKEKVGNVFGHSLIAREVLLEEGRIMYADPSGHSYSFEVGKKPKKSMDTSDFYIKPSFRKKGLGTVIREIIISEAKKRKVKEIEFPKGRAHHPEFYEERGFEQRRRKYTATIEQLDYSKNPNIQLDWSKKLEEKGFKIYWAKSGKFKKK